MHTEKDGSVRPTAAVTLTGSLRYDICQLINQELNKCSTQMTAAGLRLRMVPIRLNMDRSILAVIILCLCEVSHSLHLLLRRDACSLLPLMLLAGVLVSLLLGWRTWLLLSDYRRRIWLRGLRYRWNSLLSCLVTEWSWCDLWSGWIRKSGE